MTLAIAGGGPSDPENNQFDEDYRSIFNNLPNPVFILDRKNLMILECNLSVKDIYGYAKEEILNTSFLNFFEEGEHQNYALELRSSDTLNHVKQITKDGRGIFANILVSPYVFMGRPALLVTSNDMIRVLVVKQQLIQTSKMATLGEMTTGIAHELNQPLSVIKTASSFLLNRVEKGEKIREDIMKAMIEEIDSHVDRAGAIITHLREFGRKSEAKKEAVQVNTPLLRSLAIFRQQLKLKDIEVIEEIEEYLPAVIADSNRLEQVFINLLINARDAIEEKREKLGKVQLPQKIIIRSSLRDGIIAVRIEDTGVGIPKNLLDRIFKPFFTTKAADRGTGLGLSISYGIVQDYGGSIRVETEEEKGSAFIVQFPAQVNVNGG